MTLETSRRPEFQAHTKNAAAAHAVLHVGREHNRINDRRIAMIYIEALQNLADEEANEVEQEWEDSGATVVRMHRCFEPASR